MLSARTGKAMSTTPAFSIIDIILANPTAIGCP